MQSCYRKTLIGHVWALTIQLEPLGSTSINHIATQSTSASSSASATPSVALSTTPPSSSSLTPASSASTSSQSSTVSLVDVTGHGNLIDTSLLYGGIPKTTSNLNGGSSNSALSGIITGNSVIESINQQQQQNQQTAASANSPATISITGSSSSSSTTSPTSDYFLQLMSQSDTNTQIPTTFSSTSLLSPDDPYDDTSTAAIMSHPIYSTAFSAKRSYEIKPLLIENQITEPSVVNVDGSEQPVKVIFRTQSSPMMVRQVHMPRKPTEMERTNSIDEPHRVLHAVMRPVIQEVREIIQPYRRLTQEIRPVLEEIHTIVSKDGRDSISGPSSPNIVHHQRPRYNTRHVLDMASSELSALLPSVSTSSPPILPFRNYNHESQSLPSSSQSPIKLVKVPRDIDYIGSNHSPILTLINDPQISSNDRSGSQQLLSAGSSSSYHTIGNNNNGIAIAKPHPTTKTYQTGASIPLQSTLSSSSNLLSQGIFGNFPDIPLESFFNLKLNRNRKPKPTRL